MTHLDQLVSLGHRGAATLPDSPLQIAWLPTGPTFALPSSMRLLLVITAAASLLALTAVADAQPALDQPASDAAIPATAYLEPGLEAGITHGAVYGALELDAGYHLSDTPLWLHGRFAQGIVGPVDQDTMTSDFTEARLGLEARGCLFEGIACLVGGVDFGYRHEMFISRFEHNNADLAVGIARLGLDLGGKHLRLRSSIETGVEQGGWNGLGLTAGIAYTW
jgi:hypothetical protein